MPRRNQREAVAERAEAQLEEQHQRRSEAAQHGAQTRRQRREQQQGEAQPQPGAESGTQGNVARNMRDRVHADLLTIAYRGPLAERTRSLATQCQLSLAKLLQDAILVYEQRLAEGYQAGSALMQWKEEQTGG
jgi:hypothetical protein